ncbi:MAG: hypothetical protein LAN64_08510 [Acidobacteriia bacterium]|nr:hypothetical protein [Terriglobia bacterium]
MDDSNHIREIIERVVSVSLATHVTALKDELIDHACEQLAAAMPRQDAPPASPPGGAPTDLLNAAANSVLDSVTQTDILSSLLEGASKFAKRAALFVIRGGVATGWRATGLESRDQLKALTIDLNHGLAARAYRDRVPATASAAEFDPRFVSLFGAPADGTNAVVLPLMLRDKVAALVYADAGTQPGGGLDPSALECLVRFCGLWLEVVATRKAGTPVAETVPDSDKIPRYVEPPAHHDEAAPQQEPQAQQVEPPTPGFSAASVAAAAVTAPASVAAAAPAPSSQEEEEVHKKARRFAKLLVDEIKLYNQAKVAEGRAHQDLYARLKDDIDKSRATYDRRYGSTVAASGNYFTQELIHILANDDPALLGSGFSG